MRIIDSKTEDEIAILAAEDIIKTAKEIAKTKDIVTIALPGGRSVSKIYANLSNSTDEIWKKIHLFIVDERIVPITDAESNFKLIKDTFAAKLVIKNILPKENLHPINITQDNISNISNVVETAQQELEKYGEEFDIVLLSSGEDGHIAGLYPMHEALKISGKKFIILYDSPKPPKDRITSSVELIATAKKLILLFIGDSKLEAYKKFLDKKIAIIDCPAKIATKIKDSTIYTNINL